MRARPTSTKTEQDSKEKWNRAEGFQDRKKNTKKNATHKKGIWKLKSAYNTEKIQYFEKTQKI